MPVISAGADASDFVIESRTALMCDGRDAADLTARIVSLLDDHAAATELAAAALAHLREHHTPAKMVRAVVDVYRGALERGE